ncbi:hypothetical protein XI08_23760 [Bradyrhizobium sp. CCBAU 11361]|nr:hypothetical protein [Bradyrhizobium sp. CCBAU 11361]
MKCELPSVTPCQAPAPACQPLPAPTMQRAAGVMAEHALHRALVIMAAGLPAGMLEYFKPGVTQHAGQPG